MIAHHPKDDIRRSELFSMTLDHAVTDDEEDLVAVGVVRGRNRVQSSANSHCTLRITGNKADCVS